MGKNSAKEAYIFFHEIIATSPTTPEKEMKERISSFQSSETSGSISAIYNKNMLTTANNIVEDDASCNNI